jgi:large subunit ribosomal protein L29
MKTEELRKMSDAELGKTLREKRERLVALQFQLPTKQVKNHREVRDVRKDVSRILTIMREKQILTELKEEPGAAEAEPAKEASK